MKHEDIFLADPYDQLREPSEWAFNLLAPTLKAVKKERLRVPLGIFEERYLSFFESTGGAGTKDNEYGWGLHNAKEVD